MALPVPSQLAASQAALYRSQFDAAIAAGTKRHYVVPYSLFGCVVLPVLYLCIPHTRRPWLYRARFLVVAVAMLSTARTMAVTSSSTITGAYGAGLVPTWCTLWTLYLLVWTRPQFEAARVERRRRTKGQGGQQPGTAKTGPSGWVVDESLDATLEEWEYYWQPYPSSGTFLERLSWVMGLFLSFRGTGWTWQPRTFPAFQGPSDVQSSELVNLGSIPVVSPYGHRRYTTYREFFTTRLRIVAICYIVLDLMSVFSLNDPYWTLGPAGEQLYGLPPPLTRCPRPVIEVYRSATAFCSIVAALLCYATLQQVVVVALGPRLFGSRAQLWHQPDVFGPFGAVLDRGLGGFWGTWWHQTFRVGFSAPTEWMVRVGLLRPSGTAAALVATFVAFAQSGIMHAAGSFTTVPETWAWAPFIFFLLQFVGIAVEQALWAGVRRGMAAAGYEKGLPMRWKRVANFAFVAVWLHMTRPVLVDDFTRCGLFLFEAVPVSPARAVGLGKGSDRAIWRGAQFIPGWHSGTHWWESGFKS